MHHFFFHVHKHQCMINNLCFLIFFWYENEKVKSENKILFVQLSFFFRPWFLVEDTSKCPISLQPKITCATVTGYEFTFSLSFYRSLMAQACKWIIKCKMFPHLKQELDCMATLWSHTVDWTGDGRETALGSKLNCIISLNRDEDSN